MHYICIQPVGLLIPDFIYGVSMALEVLKKNRGEIVYYKIIFE